ncbi:MAG: cation diffusion facilitator family transporter [Parachlamydiaceae bacterium]
MNKTKYSLSPSDRKDMNFSMRISFLIGLVMLALKSYAYFITGSTAIMSDAAESIIHVFAVGFATYSMRVSLKPADSNHLYGHEKVGFFSAGIEGGLIIIAALYIYFESVYRLIYGAELQNIGAGLIFILAAITINFILGYFLLSKGKKYKSIILEANGKHILADCLTSIGVIVALALAKITNISQFDPIVAILAATNILWTGAKLLKQSICGLMDQTDLAVHDKIFSILNRETSQRNMEFHHLRHRMSGYKIFIEFHLLFDSDIKLERAHEIASEIEGALQDSLDMHAEISSHLETKMHHDAIHEKFGLPI